MDEARPAKRRQIDEIGKIEREDAALWFADGSIVLSAQDAANNVLTIVYFKVHTSVLAKHSDIFRDMFAMPSPDVIDRYDGLPLVHLHDEPKDLKELLSMLYDPSLMLTSHLRARASHALAGPLRLAIKYEAVMVRDMIIESMQQEWPSNLDDWDRVRAAALRRKSLQPVDSNDIFIPDPLPVIALARSCNIPGVLPIALYTLYGQLTSYRVAATLLAEKLASLDRQTLEIVLSGGLKLHQNICSGGIYREMCLSDWQDEGPADCDHDRTRCVPFVWKVWEQLQTNMVQSADPLETLRSTVSGVRRGTWDWAECLCGPCREELADRFGNYRLALFESLAHIFKNIP